MQRTRLSILLLLLWLGIVLVCLPPPSHAQEATTVDADALLEDDDDGDFEVLEEQEQEETIQVDDYLSTLSTTELQKICLERGFDIEQESHDKPLTHADYVDAARRCLSLEQEMNAILMQHPELAAEIEKEITRLQQQKDRLEQERAALWAEKELLEAQLEQAGVDLLQFQQQQQQQAVVAAAPKDPADMNFPELLVESLRQLFHRVQQDFLFVAKVTQPVWKATQRALDIGWRYSKPAVMQAWRYAKPTLLQAYAEVRKRVQQVLPKKEDS